MFVENEYVRPLYDPVNGGPPRAFKCLLAKDAGVRGRVLVMEWCNKVTRTEIGMKAHLKRVHCFEEQQCLFSTASLPVQNENQVEKPVRLKKSSKPRKKVSLTKDTGLEPDHTTNQPLLNGLGTSDETSPNDTKGGN